MLAVAVHAADAPKVLEPRSENGTPIVYRATRLDVPPGTAVRLQVSLAKDRTECFDTSIIDWHKELIDGRRFHTISFDAARSTPGGGKTAAGCPKRESGFLGLHTVDLPAEKGKMQVWITYREGEEVTAQYAPEFSTEGATPGTPGRPAKKKP